MEQSTNLNKILGLLSHNLSYNLLVLATDQLFSIAANDPAINFVRILDFYKKLIVTNSESTRTTLPRIIIPCIVKFYSKHRECIDDLILSHKKRRAQHKENIKNIARLKEIEANDEDIWVGEEPKSKKKREVKWRRKKDAGKDSKKELQSEIINFEDEEIKLYDSLSHNLKDDSGLLQLEDVDINYIVFYWKPLVLSTSKQLEEENEKEIKDLKLKKKNMRRKKNNFDSYASLDNLKKKTADTAGTLQSKNISIQSHIESCWKRSISEFLNFGSKSMKKTSINSRRSKRVKKEIIADEDLIENVYFDPILSLYFFFRNRMLSEKWNERQYWCANLIYLYKHINFGNYLANIPDLNEVDRLEEWLKTDLCTRGLILTLVDHFSDFQENRLLSPVRELSVKLTIPCFHMIPINSFWNTILANKKLYWMYKYNVLLLLKNVLVEGRKLKARINDLKDKETERIISMVDKIKKNKKILDNVFKCMDGEDEVKIIAGEWIQEMWETLLSEDSDSDDGKGEEEEIKEDGTPQDAGLGGWSYKGVDYNEIIENVFDNSDDIECTVISVFNLLITIAK